MGQLTVVHRASRAACQQSHAIIRIDLENDLSQFVGAPATIRMINRHFARKCPEIHHAHVPIKRQWHGTCFGSQYGMDKTLMPKHSRRDILRGAFRESREPVIRPPGAQPEFDRLCDDCGRCSRACPQRIVRHAASGGPKLDFYHGPCTFCGDCAQACPTGALAVEDQVDWPWRATILKTCLSFRGISCRTCEDACEHRAIRFRLQTGGRAVPVLDQEQCTGCGECAFTCPAQSVAFERPKPAKTEITA